MDTAADDVDPHQPTVSVIPDQAFADDILRRKDLCCIHSSVHQRIR
jgi:hypothetical protein